MGKSPDYISKQIIHTKGRVTSWPDFGDIEGVKGRVDTLLGGHDLRDQHHTVRPIGNVREKGGKYWDESDCEKGNSHAKCRIIR